VVSYVNYIFIREVKKNGRKMNGKRGWNVEGKEEKMGKTV